MSEPVDKPGPLRSSRVLIISLTTTIVVMALALVLLTIARSGAGTGQARSERVNVLSNSKNTCVTCHKRSTPGIVEQYGHSTMAAADVRCQDCHEVEEQYPGALAHEGTFVLGSPTTAMCQKCHSNEVAQFNQSRHALPAYVAYAGTEDLIPAHMEQYEAIPEGGFRPDRLRNALFEMQGPDINRFTCQPCHNIGKPALDGSVGQCQKCHLRHEFSLEQARKPETCNSCHIGPDHPQWEIYIESAHGIAYQTGGDRWHWEATPGTLTPEDFPAPTCATCHISGFGASGTTHDVGDRLTWYLFAPVSTRRPVWQENKVRMQNTCRTCHNQNFVESFYEDADRATVRVNEWVEESNRIIEPLKKLGLLTAEPFDEPIDFVHFELWHHWGRTTKFGVWMQGADYAQWHGAYEVFSDLAELKQMVEEKLEEARENE